MTEHLWDIPSSWQWTAIKKLGDVVSGGTPSTKAPEYWGGNVIWFTPSDLTGCKSKFIARGAKTLTDEGLAKSSAKAMPAGSVMFSSRAPVGYVAINEVPSATNQGFKSIIPHQELFNEYLYYYLKAAKHIAETRATGTTFKELSGSAFAALPVPMSPTNEQRRIVERIEALFAEIDRGVESLRAAKSTIGLYRQSLLKSAFEGRLTADWRAQNPDKLENPDALLARIRKERESRYKAALGQWERDVAEWKERGKSGERLSKPRKPRPLSTHKPESHDASGVLAAGWLWLTVESVGAVQLGRQRSPKNRSNQFPTKYIRAANITEDGLNLDDLLDMEFLPHELSAYRLEEGDLLLAEASGSAGKVGKAAIWDNQVPDCCFQNTVIRHRAFCRDFVGYLLWVYRYFYVSERFARVAGGVGINHLSVSRFAQMSLPICSPAEQAEIVRILDARLDAAEALEAEIDVNLTRADALRQSILRKAFSGRLVPQDPNDEPASALLARIRADREAAPSEHSKKRTKA